ncbi:DUF4873 domain-containing protein [Rhodococcus sp. NPDC058521]|uniref:DUF4873 domain-containing protein n=1 Tax=Rhodococcus sp. NPDC058521 TaxID=3346536 RepID=UPI00364A18F3
MSEPEFDGYTGPAQVTVGERTVTTAVQLTGNFEPISGRYLWRGRVRGLTEILGTEVPDKTTLTITTPDRSGDARVTGLDLWGSHLVEGTTQPPFEHT